MNFKGGGLGSVSLSTVVVSSTIAYLLFIGTVLGI
jgi:hypothetical protein